MNKIVPSLFIFCLIYASAAAAADKGLSAADQTKLAERIEALDKSQDEVLTTLDDIAEGVRITKIRASSVNKRHA